MNEIEKSNRRVEMSAVLSDAVYKYEIAYTAGRKNPTEMAVGVLDDAGVDSSSYEIVDCMYDKDSGVAAIAVYDKFTEETYISYAGTNYKADGHKDIIVDAAIGINDSLYLKNKYDMPEDTTCRIILDYSSGTIYGISILMESKDEAVQIDLTIFKQREDNQ